MRVILVEEYNFVVVVMLDFLMILNLNDFSFLLIIREFLFFDKEIWRYDFFVEFFF